MKNKELVIKLKADIADYKAKLEVATQKMNELEGESKNAKGTFLDTFKGGAAVVGKFAGSLAVAVTGVVSVLKKVNDYNRVMLKTSQLFKTSKDETKGLYDKINDVATLLGLSLIHI